MSKARGDFIRALVRVDRTRDELRRMRGTGVIIIEWAIIPWEETLLHNTDRDHT
jgi:hypothetical protein